MLSDWAEPQQVLVVLAVADPPAPIQVGDVGRAADRPERHPVAADPDVVRRVPGVQRERRTARSRSTSVTMSGSKWTRCVPGSTVAPGRHQQVARFGVEEVHPDLGQDPERPDVDRLQLVGRDRLGRAVRHPRLRPRALLRQRRCGRGPRDRRSRRRRRPSPAAVSMSVMRRHSPEQVEPGRLELRVAVERGEPLVAPEAGLLVATERHRDVGRIERVDPDDAGPDPAREPVGPVHVARPDPGRQPVRRVVGDGERLGLVVELGHGQDRPEDLLARDPHRVGDAVEDGRRDVVAAAVLADALAAGDDAGAFLAAEVHVAEDLGQLPLVHDRARASSRGSSGFARRERRARTPRSAPRAPRGRTGGR